MEFIGNKKTINFLQKAVKSGNLNHAYLFYGPEHVGKFSLAKVFAQHLIKGLELGLEMDFFDKDAVLDLLIVEPEVTEKNGVSKQKDISIETVREVQKSLSLFPYHGKCKVLIINDAHRLNASSQNGLLKLLEEPNQTSILILVTHQPKRILPTVESRCQIINFNLATDEEIAAVFPREINLCMGRPGLAKIFSEDNEIREKYSDAERQLRELLKSSLADKLKMAEQFSKDIVAAIEKMNVWVWILRGGDEYAMIEKIEASMDLLKSTNANGRLLLESLFMDM